MEGTQRPADTTQPAQPPNNLVATLRRCCDVLAKSCDADDVALKTLTARRRALVVAAVFLSAMEQQPAAALGVDFVAAARWLVGYYEHAAQGLAEQSRPVLVGSNGQALGGNGAAAASLQLGRVGDALCETAASWREIAEAAEDRAPCLTCGHTDPKHSAAHLRHCGEDCPCAAKAQDTATYHGVVRIWTAVVASLCNTVTSRQVPRGGSQEVVVMTQVMVQTAREAAVMAALLGGEQVGQVAEG